MRLLLALLLLLTLPTYGLSKEVFKETALEAKPFDLKEAKRLAEVYAAKGELSAAREAYDRILDFKDDDAGLHFAAGNVLLRLGEYASAAARFRKASVLEPDNPAYLNNLAWCLGEVGETDEAQRAVRKALFLDPGAAYVYLDTRGVVEMKAGDYRASEKTLTEALQRTPSFDKKGLNYVLGHLLELYELSDKKRKAEETRKRLNSLDGGR